MKYSKLQYRPEIDGLRAIAVISVILYHLELPFFGRDWFEGGFIGVDIFFVTSGYLISRIILFELETQKSFSFFRFFEARARRTIPMLFVVFLVSMPYAWKKLLPSDFVEYAESILASAFFISNFFFYINTTEYGAASSLLKPFLHTWSLGVEQQFYIIFPVVIILLVKYFRIKILTIFVTIFFSSLVFSMLIAEARPELNFYLPFSRFWEFAVGALLADREMNQREPKKNLATYLLSLLGFLMVLSGILLFDEKIPHPSLYTLLPVVGVSLIIAFASGQELVGRILGIKVFVWVGVVSYSAYLWHFPLFAFSRVGGDFLDQRDKVELLFVTLALSVISYFLIERPFRKVIGFKIFIISVFAAGSFVIIISFLIISSNGFATKFRFGFDPDIIQSVEPSYLFGDDGCDVNDEIIFNETQFCVLGDSAKSKIDFLLLGDSHARHAQPLLNRVSRQMGLKGIFGGNSGCLPLLGVYPLRGTPHPNDWSRRCYAFNQNGYEFAKTNDIDIVVLVARWDYYVDGANTGDLNNISDVSLRFGDIDQTRRVYNDAINRTFNAYRALGVKVVVLLQVPHQNVNVRRFLEGLLSGTSIESRRRMFDAALADAVERQEHLQRQSVASAAWIDLAYTNNESDLFIIDPTPYFCNMLRCPFIVEDHAFYTDFDHASEQGYDRLEDEVLEALRID